MEEVASGGRDCLRRLTSRTRYTTLYLKGVDEERSVRGDMRHSDFRANLYKSQNNNTRDMRTYYTYVRVGPNESKLSNVPQRRSQRSTFNTFGIFVVHVPIKAAAERHARATRTTPF